ncbi:hypothetical protein ACFVR6_03610 [Microbacterium sp. NPDC058021]|uniref:hypothetical protein n=1 Tax=Microbacterium sp. NPDC058021 TaxID=3346306 RepID=UPI0036DD809B
MELWGQIFTGLVALIIGFGTAWAAFRGKKVDAATKETEVEAAATSAFLDGQKAFQEYVNGVVADETKAAVADLQQQVTDLRAELKKVKDESHEMNDAIRARETQLWLWNFRNRSGPMPELPLPVLKRLGLTHLSPLGDVEDTQPVPEEEP